MNFLFLLKHPCAFQGGTGRMGAEGTKQMNKVLKRWSRFKMEAGAHL
jgi:hypothetical protein